MAVIKPKPIPTDSWTDRKGIVEISRELIEYHPDDVVRALAGTVVLAVDRPIRRPFNYRYCIAAKEFRRIAEGEIIPRYEILVDRWTETVDFREVDRIREPGVVYQGDRKRRGLRGFLQDIRNGLSFFNRYAAAREPGRRKRGSSFGGIRKQGGS